VPHQKKKEFLSKISFVSPQKSRLIYDVNAMDNILLFGTAYGITPRKIKSKAEYMAEVLNIAHKLKQQVRTLSFGERVKIELISGFIHEPVLASLDEPLIGLDFLTVENILKFFKSLKSQIIMTSHIFKEQDKITNKILILNQGEQCFYGGWEIFNEVYAEKRVITVKTSYPQNLSPIFKQKGNNTYTATINAGDSQRLYDELVKIFR
jgi:ABC-2 type transport system ATP-binding protein